jgi:cysteine-S-conjugate beta-lyase
MSPVEEFDTLIYRKGLNSGRDLFRPDSAKRIGSPTFSFAEMDFRMPECIRRAFFNLVETGFCGYTVENDPVYGNAICGWMWESRNWEIEPGWITTALGTLRAMGTAVRAFSNEGDGVIVLSPGYHHFIPVIERNHRKPVYSVLKVVGTSMVIDFDDLAEKMAQLRNSMFFLCNPHNPAMRIWKWEELQSIAALAKRYGIMVVVDEMFGDLCWSGTSMTAYGRLPEARDHCVIVTSLAKTFNVTGLNHAHVIIPPGEPLAAFRQQHGIDQCGSGSIEPFVRAATIAGYSPEGKAWLGRMMSYVEENIQMARDFFARALPAVRVMEHDAGYLIWTDWRGLGWSDAQLQHFLMEEAAFGVDMGTEYGPGGEGFIRINLGTSHAEVEKGLQRICDAGGKL